MKLLFDLFPVILFFVTFKVAGNYEAESLALATDWLGSGFTAGQAPIMLATAVAIVATFAQIGWVWMRHRKVDTMLWVSLAVIVVFGGATILFHNETFIKWKPTVLYWLFAAVLLGSSVFFRRNLLQAMLKDKIQMPEPGWRVLNLSWSGFFTFMGFANLFVAYTFSTDIWVNFKLFGGLGLMFLFVLAQGALLSKYVQEDQQ